MSNQKLWAGRFSQNSDAQADSFNTSLPFDCRMYREDILGSIAHCTMLGECSIIDSKDSALIIKTLKDILQDIDDGKLNFTEGEDIHMWTETELTRRIGVVGKRLHTARSRNDQVALDLRLYLRREIDHLADLLRTYANTLINLAEQNLTTYMPGYTHLQHAQPITLAHHLSAYVQMALRDLDRLKDCRRRLNVLPLGSCALATTTHPINRERVAALLGFDAVCENSLDGVSDRDFCAEFLADAAILMMHLSRLCEEIILWSTSEFSFIELSDAYSTGSSIMPQKKNPDMTELIRGKTGRVYGDLTALLTLMKGLPLAYNKDMQEDKENVFDAIDTVKACLGIISPVLSTATFHKDVMRNGASAGFAAATDLADYLVKHGMSFREAHEVIGTIVKDCITQGRVLEDLTAQDYQRYSALFGSDVTQAITLDTMVGGRDRTGGPAPKAVEQALMRAKKIINND